METISSIISSAYWSVMHAFASLLPNSEGFTMDIQGAITQVMSMGKQLSFVINWPVIFDCLMFVLAFEMAFLLFKITLVIIDFIRGSGA